MMDDEKPALILIRKFRLSIMNITQRKLVTKGVGETKYCILICNIITWFGSQKDVDATIPHCDNINILKSRLTLFQQLTE